MKVVNHTPWPHLCFESRTPFGSAFGVLVLRGTFEIVQEASMRPLPAQEPVALRNIFAGDPSCSSMCAEADLAPFKPRTDIHVQAIARAPGGKPSREWPVRVRVGERIKDLRVLGPHEWRYRATSGWERTAPQPCFEVPLLYEYAFGGRFNLEEGLIYNDENPVGTGWIPNGVPRDQPIAAPQVMSLDEPPHAPGRRVRPQGVGPLLPHWKARLDRAGTFDDRWRATRWPHLPENFDWSFYNSAHPDLVYSGYVKGGESIDLVHFNVKRPVLRTALPKYWIYAWTSHANGLERAFGIPLDTVHLDVRSPNPSEHRAYLTWRVPYPLEPPVHLLQIRMRTRENSVRIESLEREEGRAEHG